MTDKNEQTQSPQKVNSLQSYFLNKIKMDWLQVHFGFILWIVFFLILYISNGHRTIKMIRKINKLNTEVAKMKYQYLIYKSELTNLTQQGTLSVAMKKNKLNDLNTPPIILNDSLNND